MKSLQFTNAAPKYVDSGTKTATHQRRFPTSGYRVSQSCRHSASELAFQVAVCPKAPLVPAPSHSSRGKRFPVDGWQARYSPLRISQRKALLDGVIAGVGEVTGVEVETGVAEVIGVGDRKGVVEATGVGEVTGVGDINGVGERAGVGEVTGVAVATGVGVAL